MIGAPTATPLNSIDIPQSPEKPVGLTESPREPYVDRIPGLQTAMCFLSCRTGLVLCTSGPKSQLPLLPPTQESGCGASTAKPGAPSSPEAGSARPPLHRRQALSAVAPSLSWARFSQDLDRRASTTHSWGPLWDC